MSTLDQQVAVFTIIWSSFHPHQTGKRAVYCPPHPQQFYTRLLSYYLCTVICLNISFLLQCAFGLNQRLAVSLTKSSRHGDSVQSVLPL